MSQYCPECGVEKNEKSRFCTGCKMQFDTCSTVLLKKQSILNERYEIVDLIKSGAMGCVYKARDTRLNNFVAVKQMLGAFTNPSDENYARERFREEGRILSTLHHNGLPKVIDYFTEKKSETASKSHFLVMTFIEGEDLEAYIKKRENRPFSVDEVIDYSNQVLDILEYLHTQNPPLIYRDLNPRNIMIQGKKIFLVDFGIARVFKPREKGTAIGTPGYSAPEQYKGESEPRSDIYSLGVLMYYLLTGKDPEDPSNKLFSFENIRNLNPSVPEGLETLIMSMLDVVPDNRPGSMENVRIKLCLLNKPLLSMPSYPMQNQNQLPLRMKRKRRVMVRFLLVISLTFFISIMFFCNSMRNDSRKIPDNIEIPCRMENHYLKISSVQNAQSAVIASSGLKQNDNVSPLQAACLDNNRDLVKALISKGTNVNSKDALGHTALHIAAERNYKEIAELLISNNANVNSRNRDGITPLHCACLNNSKETAEFLVSKGANIDSKDILGSTALHLASERDYEETVKLMISLGADINAKDNDGWTPLYFTSRNNNRDISELLISKGADVNEKDKEGYTPLHIACLNNCRDAALLLISKGADVKSRDRCGRTPLHLPGAFGYLGIVEILVSKGADINAKDNDGCTALKLAAGQKHYDVVNFLVSKGAKE